jgi:coenzyme F420-0:L-glutamate ligase/coenzyme F420-1:gamma-L-glutamate ligase
MLPSVTLTPLPGIPLIEAGDDLAALIIESLKRAGVVLQGGDVLVVTSKIVSKAENRTIHLDTIEPSAEAHRLAAVTGKDPRIVEVVLRESVSVSRAAPGILVVRHRLGFVSANAGIDQSNIADGDNRVLLLPIDPDRSARELQEAITTIAGVPVGIVISDSHGRPFRMGNVGVAIGVAGLPAVLDLRGQTDLYGRTLRITVQGYADMIASAAGLVTGEGAEGKPVVLVRGLGFPAHHGTAQDLIRPPEQDLYRNSP